MNELKMHVGGMGCGRCVGKVDAALRAVGGVDVRNVSLGSAEVQYDPARTSPQAIAAAVAAAGYSVQPSDAQGE